MKIKAERKEEMFLIGIALSVVATLSTRGWLLCANGIVLVVLTLALGNFYEKN